MWKIKEVYENELESLLNEEKVIDFKIIRTLFSNKKGINLYTIAYKTKSIK